MREIPPLHVLCLRVVGAHNCSAETTFAKDENGEPSPASRLLRSFHNRPVASMGDETTAAKKDDDDDDDNDDSSSKQKQQQKQQQLPPMRRTPCIGDGSARRAQANEVDLHHPFVGCKVRSDAGTNLTLVMEYGNPALDCLQSLIDSLVELGRMDDTRLGIHFFQEWKANVLIAATGSAKEPEPPTPAPAPVKTSKKRRRGGGSSSPAPPPKNDVGPPILGSISLHNCSFAAETMDAIVKSQMGRYVAVLDLSGINGLSDDMLERFLPQCTQLQRLSLKNCRRVAQRGLEAVTQHQALTLTSLDVGGVYNIHVDDLLEALPRFEKLEELHASGLGWTDDQSSSLTQVRSDWKALSLSYSLKLSQTGLRQALVQTADSLESISLAFCETVVDNAVLGMLGRNLPNVVCLDVRGNSNVTTLTGWYDGRVSADLPAGQPLTVLGRYSGLSESSVEETRRVHPLESSDLIVVLDGTGTGLGIRSVLA